MSTKTKETIDGAVFLKESFAKERFVSKKKLTKQLADAKDLVISLKADLALLD